MPPTGPDLSQLSLLGVPWGEGYLQCPSSICFRNWALEPKKTDYRLHVPIVSEASPRVHLENPNLSPLLLP